MKKQEELEITLLKKENKFSKGTGKRFGIQFR